MRLIFVLKFYYGQRVFLSKLFNKIKAEKFIELNFTVEKIRRIIIKQNQTY